MNRTPTHTAVYPQTMRPTQYDGAHFLCYLNESEADYQPDEDSDPVPGVAYSGDLEDGGTLIECDEWNRDKLINGILRTRYLQTEEDAIKTHQIQLLQSEAGIESGSISAETRAEYLQEWEAFQAFRQQVITLVDSWGPWE